MLIGKTDSSVTLGNEIDDSNLKPLPELPFSSRDQTEVTDPKRTTRVRRQLDCPVWAIVTSASFSLFLIVVSILLFYLFPQIPDIGIIGAATGVSGDNLQFGINPINFRMDISLNASVYNPNYVGIWLNEMKGVGYLPDQPDLAVANSTFLSAHLPMRRRTFLQVPVSVIYNTGMHASTLRNLLDKCGLSGDEKRANVDMNLKLNLTVTVIGITFNLNDVSVGTSFACPIDASKYSGLGTLLDVIGNGNVLNTISNIGNTVGSIINTVAPDLQLSVPTVNVNLPNLKLPIR